MRQLKITKKITERNSDSIGCYFNEISKIKLLTTEQEIELADQIAKGSQEALTKIVEANLRFVISVAKNYQNQGLPLEDLINEGNIGLIKAASKFDNNRGFKFISYAVWWIRQGMLQAISEQSRLIRIPSNQTISINKLNKTFAKLEQQFEREPTDEELQEVLIDTDIKVRDIRTIGGRAISLDAPIKEGEDMSYGDFIVNKESKRPDEIFNFESMQKDLEKVLNKLIPRQKRILCMYFGLLGYQSMTLEEIGYYFDLTRERVRQIKDTSLRILKCRKNSHVLRQYFGVEHGV